MATPDVKIKISAVDETQKAFQSVQDNLGGLKNSLFSVQNAIKAALGGVLVTSVLKTNAEFQKLQASLETFSGSAEIAAQQFAALQQFAAKTPFTLQEVVGGFNILTARGINPTIATLESFGNIASGAGKSLNQLIEAVADAGTGEFERLKEFGIKANKEGETIKFTFGGVTTSVSNNTNEILGYLEKLGNTKFAGGVDRQAATLTGAFSNFQDSIDALFVAIGKAGLNDFFGTLAKQGAELASIITKNAESLGKFNAAITIAEVFGKALKVIWETIAISVANVAFVFRMVGREIGGISAQISALARFDFKGAAFIGEAMKEDAKKAREELDAFEAKIMGLGETAKAVKIDLPKIATPPTPKGEMTATEKAQWIKGWVAYADAVIDENERIEEALRDISYREIKDQDDARKKMMQQWFELIDKEQEDAIAMGQIIMDQSSGIKEQTDLVKELGLTFTSAFESAIVGGKGLSSVLKGIGRDILQIATRKLVTEPFGNAITAGLKSWIGGQSWIGGARANGGPVDGNTPYLVGERGPELFVPSSSGSIVPNHAMGGSTVVNQTINVTTGVAQTVRAEIMTLMPQIANAAKSAVADAKLRGGSYAAAMR